MIQTSFVANEDMYNMAKSLEQLRQYDDVKLSTLYKEALNRNLSKSELANYHQAVYERFRDLLHYVAEMLCKRYKLLRTGEDIINEVFLKLFEGKWTKTFNSGESLKYYLLKSVRNLTLDYCRKKGRESRALEDSFHELSSAVSSISIPDKELIPERLQELLQGFCTMNSTLFS